MCSASPRDGSREGRVGASSPNKPFLLLGLASVLHDIPLAHDTVEQCWQSCPGGSSDGPIYFVAEQLLKRRLGPRVRYGLCITESTPCML